MIVPLLFRRQFFAHSVIPPTRSSNFHRTIRNGVSSILQPGNFLSILFSSLKDGATVLSAILICANYLTELIWEGLIFLPPWRQPGNTNITANNVYQTTCIISKKGKWIYKYYSPIFIQIIKLPPFINNGVFSLWTLYLRFLLSLFYYFFY